MEGDGVLKELDFVCIVLLIGIAFWPLLFPCGRTAAVIPLWKNSSYWIAWCFPSKPMTLPQPGCSKVLTFMKISSDFSREVLKFMKISSQKHWVYDTS